MKRQVDLFEWIMMSGLTVPAAAMSLAEPASDSVPFFSDDSEAEGPEEQGRATGQGPAEEPASGVSETQALLTVFILSYINLLNYMDRFTVAGAVFLLSPHSSQSNCTCISQRVKMRILHKAETFVKFRFSWK